MIPVLIWHLNAKPVGHKCGIMVNRHRKHGLCFPKDLDHPEKSAIKSYETNYAMFALG